MNSNNRVAGPVLNDYMETNGTPEADEGPVRERVSNALSDNEAFRQLPAPIRRGAVHEMVDVLSELTDIPIVDLLAAGWRKHDTLLEAGRRTAGTDHVEVVDLVTHEIVSVHHPYVDITLRGQTIATVYFELRCQFLVKALTASVRRGRLTALHSGDCQVVGAMLISGQEVARLEGLMTLPVDLHLGEGVPLL